MPRCELVAGLTAPFLLWLQGMSKPAIIALATLLLGVTQPAPARLEAAPVPVRFTEGVMRGFPVLRSLSGEKLAQGDLVQIARGDRVESRLLFRFTDGSIHDETAVYSQRGVFTLLSYRLVQRGPSFPETIEASIDRETERYEVRYRADEDSPEEILRGRFTLPPDAYNGLLLTLMKNLPQGQSTTVQVVAFTPRPHLVKLQLVAASEDLMLVGDQAIPAVRFVVRPQLGLFASLLVTDVPDIKYWILAGEAPAFVKFEGPLYFQGPIWRIELN